MNNYLSNYNFKEKTYVLGGAITGFAAPIVATRYIVFGNSQPKGAFGEACLWGLSLGVNMLPTLVKKFPIPVYTSYAGVVAGIMIANKSKNQKNLESLTN